MKLAIACVSFVALAQAHAQTCDEWAYLDPAPPVGARVCAHDPSRQGVLSFALMPVPASPVVSPAQTLQIQDGVWTLRIHNPDERFLSGESDKLRQSCWLTGDGGGSDHDTWRFGPETGNLARNRLSSPRRTDPPSRGPLQGAARRRRGRPRWSWSRADAGRG